MAEDTGLIFPLGEFVLREVCRLAAEWRQTPGLVRNGNDADLVISVNISGKQFLQPALLAQVQQILNDSRLPPDRLSLEITESVLMDQAETAVDRLGKLKALGVGLGIDDFGTGYSSLSYLRRFPIDTLKIDCGFVAAAMDNADSAAIVRTIVSLGLSLGLKVVAEGVETIEQLTFLRQCGCQFVQGYYFSRPVPAERVPGLLRQWNDEIALLLSRGGDAARLPAGANTAR